MSNLFQVEEFIHIVLMFPIYDLLAHVMCVIEDFKRYIGIFRDKIGSSYDIVGTYFHYMSLQENVLDKVAANPKPELLGNALEKLQLTNENKVAAADLLTLMYDSVLPDSLYVERLSSVTRSNTVVYAEIIICILKYNSAISLRYHMKSIFKMYLKNSISQLLANDKLDRINNEPAFNHALKEMIVSKYNEITLCDKIIIDDIHDNAFNNSIRVNMHTIEFKLIELGNYSVRLCEINGTEKTKDTMYNIRNSIKTMFSPFYPTTNENYIVSLNLLFDHMNKLPREFRHFDNICEHMNGSMIKLRHHAENETVVAVTRVKLTLHQMIKYLIVEMSYLSDIWLSAHKPPTEVLCMSLARIGNILKNIFENELREMFISYIDVALSSSLFAVLQFRHSNLMHTVNITSVECFHNVIVSNVLPCIRPLQNLEQRLELPQVDIDDDIIDYDTLAYRYWLTQSSSYKDHLIYAFKIHTFILDRNLTEADISLCVSVYHTLYKYCYKRKQFDDARNFIVVSIYKCDGHSDVFKEIAYLYRDYGNVLHKLGKYKEALSAHATALSIDPFLVQSYIYGMEVKLRNKEISIENLKLYFHKGINDFQFKYNNFSNTFTSRRDNLLAVLNLCRFVCECCGTHGPAEAYLSQSKFYFNCIEATSTGCKTYIFDKYMMFYLDATLYYSNAMMRYPTDDNLVLKTIAITDSAIQILANDFTAHPNVFSLILQNYMIALINVPNLPNFSILDVTQFTNCTINCVS